MGVQVLPAECREFARRDVSIDIEDTPKTLPALPTRDWEHAKYTEVEDRPDLFRGAWSKPDDAVIGAMRSAGFDLPLDAIVLQGEAGDPAGVWLAAPMLVPIGKLRQLPHGA